MSDDIGRRPNDTCGYRKKTARKAHRCGDCLAQINKGVLYVQDDYYAPFGNGKRFCLACAEANERAEMNWRLGKKSKWNLAVPKIVGEDQRKAERQSGA